MFGLSVKKMLRKSFSTIPGPKPGDRGRRRRLSGRLLGSIPDRVLVQATLGCCRAKTAWWKTSGTQTLFADGLAKGSNRPKAVLVRARYGGDAPHRGHSSIALLTSQSTLNSRFPKPREALTEGRELDRWVVMRPRPSRLPARRRRNAGARRLRCPSDGPRLVAPRPPNRPALPAGPRPVTRRVVPAARNAPCIAEAADGFAMAVGETAHVGLGAQKRRQQRIEPNRAAMRL
jgi:hypothetical protein